MSRKQILAQHTTGARRRRGRAYFALFRAHLQGLNAADLQERYFEPLDPRVLHSELERFRDELVVQARLLGRVDLAEVLGREVGAPRVSPGNTPTLDEFAARYPPGFMTERDLLAEYEREVGRTMPSGPARRAAAIDAQLAALAVLESAALPEAPTLESEVDIWLRPAVAQRLIGAGLRTFGDVLARVRPRPRTWWRSVPGMGRNYASQVARQLDVIEDGEVPWSLESVPSTLRGGPHPGGLADDVAALAEWCDQANPAYQSEIERFVLWMVRVPGRAASTAVAEDLEAFDAFAADPPATWRSSARRESPAWRPFRGPLSAAGRARTLRLIRAFLSWLDSRCGREQRFMDGRTARRLTAEVFPRETLVWDPVEP